MIGSGLCTLRLEKLVGLHARRSRATGLWAGRPARPKPGDLRDIAQDSVNWRLVVSCGGMNGEPEQTTLVLAFDRGTLLLSGPGGKSVTAGPWRPSGPP